MPTECRLHVFNNIVSAVEPLLTEQGFSFLFLFFIFLGRAVD